MTSETGSAVGEPPSGSMSAWDLAESLVEALRQRPELVILDDYDEGHGIEVNFETDVVRLFEARIRAALRNGAIRP